MFAAGGGPPAIEIAALEQEALSQGIPPHMVHMLLNMMGQPEGEGESESEPEGYESMEEGIDDSEEEAQMMGLEGMPHGPHTFSSMPAIQFEAGDDAEDDADNLNLEADNAEFAANNPCSMSSMAAFGSGDDAEDVD